MIQPPASRKEDPNNFSKSGPKESLIKIPSVRVRDKA